MGKLRYRLLFLFLFLLLLIPATEAREWAIVGPRALGMGGAGVAVANDATAAYWNPAAYGLFKSKARGDYGKRDWSAVGDVGIGAQLHEDLGKQINTILQYDYNNFTSGQIAADDVPEFLQLVSDLKTFDENKNRAATIIENAGVGVQVGHFGIGGYVFGDVSAKGDLDLVNIAPVTSGTTFTLNDFTNPANYGCSPCTGGTYLTAQQKADLDTFLAGLGWSPTQRTDYINAMDFGLTQANTSGATIPADIVNDIETVAALADAAANSGGSFADNQSRLLFKGIAIAEVPFTYGQAITESFAVGGNIKYMKARVYNTAVPLFNTDFGDALDKAMDDYEDSQSFGIDIGILYHLSDTLRLGLVGRNVNSPKFDMKRLSPGDSDHITEKGQARVGVAFKPMGFLTLATDLDITKNETTVSGDYRSQNACAGLELDIVRFLKLRIGAYKNLAENDIGFVYTAGFGLNLWLVNVDVGASMAEETSELDDNDIPKEAKVEMALSMLF